MKEEIKKQFDNKFIDYPGGVYLKDKPAREKDILDFIEDIIQQERERIIKIIERAREETEKEHGSPNVYIDMVSEIAIEEIKNPLTINKLMKKKCNHKNKVYSPISYSNNNGITSPWICKDCGFEGEDFVKHYANNEYEEIRRKFGKDGTIILK